MRSAFFCSDGFGRGASKQRQRRRAAAQLGSGGSSEKIRIKAGRREFRKINAASFVGSFLHGYLFTTSYRGILRSMSSPVFPLSQRRAWISAWLLFWIFCCVLA